MHSALAVATGFATLDYALELSEQFHGTGTKSISHRSEPDWPRAGGAALYSCSQFVKAGIDAAPVTWIGSDAGAECYIETCRKYSVRVDGIETQSGRTTPTCILIYQPDGDYGCLFDSGTCSTQTLSVQQRVLLRSADLVLLAAGPPSLGNEILSLIRPDAVVTWIAKTDRSAYPLALRAMYSARSDYIFCNAGEREFVDSSFLAPRAKTQVIIETRGADGVLIDTFDGKSVVPVDFVESSDTTGAGDTLAGGTMAQILSGNLDLRSAVEGGIAASLALLRGRREASHDPATK